MENRDRNLQNVDFRVSSSRLIMLSRKGYIYRFFDILVEFKMTLRSRSHMNHSVVFDILKKVQRLIPSP